MIRIGKDYFTTFVPMAMLGGAGCLFFNINVHVQCT